jgi:putative endonuclease
VYIVTNPGKTVLYAGVTNDLQRRLSEHLHDNLNDRETFAGKYFCYNLVYYEWYSDIRIAISREKTIKKWSRQKKEQLINSFNPEIRFLNDSGEREKGGLPVRKKGDVYWNPGRN